MPTSPGGINDISGRLVARHLGRHLPGKPNIVVQNQPGAGGLANANVLYNSAEKDGSVISMMERAIPLLAITGDPNAKFDPMQVHLARQPVVLRQRRLSHADQRDAQGAQRRRHQEGRGR